MKDMITDIDLERTKKQKFCSAPFIRNIMKQLKLERVPCASTIAMLELKMKFSVTRVAIHPNAQLHHDEIAFSLFLR